MERLSRQILEHAEALPEGAPITAKMLLHLGNRAAIDQALSRLARRGHLLRAAQGLYLRPAETRYGVRPPSAEKVVEAIAQQRGESVASSAAAAANALGLTTQVPARVIYLTTGRSRTLKLGAQLVEMKHAPRWQLALAGRPAGEAVRALAWAGPEKAAEVWRSIKHKLPEPELRAIASVRALLPSWIAEQVSDVAVNG
ncbi:MAG: DUF6088 family protein [Rhodospirillales bacterium]|nr:DUF6088 family protein [Rhodospirillales bacterium]